MAVAPSFPQILLEVAQSLGVGIKTQDKHKISRLEKPLNDQNIILSEVMTKIADSLGMSQDQFFDVQQNILHAWVPYNKELELNLWTGSASQEQVIWHLLAYSYIPALARHLAFWQLDMCTDKGMPGGKFWYLPRIREGKETKREVALPVASVVEWLMDLLGVPMDQATGGFAADYKRDSIERNLYNWWYKGQTPTVSKIHEYFSDQSKFEFNGCFKPEDTQSLDQQWEAVCSFIEQKGLSDEQLAHEIPVPAKAVKACKEGRVNDDRKRFFIQCISDRYSKPSLTLIRQRFAVARMVQDGYKRLLKYLCPNVSVTCPDASENKLLQLAASFQHIYNLTIEAWENVGPDEHKEQEYFEHKIPTLLKHGLYLSIIKSFGNTTKMLGNHLTYRFRSLAENDELPDICPTTEDSCMDFFEAEGKHIQEYFKQLERIDDLRGILAKSTPWKHLKKESDFWVISQASLSFSDNPTLYEKCIRRLSEIAATSSDRVAVQLFILDLHLNKPRNAWSNQSQHLVTEALAALNSEPDSYKIWQGPILQYKAKHCLAQNDFEQALKYFREALEACKNHNHGPLRGEVARDAFALEVAISPLVPSNQEKYFRHILDSDILEGGNPLEQPSLEDIAKQLSDYFWSILYKPYHGEKRLAPFPNSGFIRHFQQVMLYSQKNDWKGLRLYLKKSPEKYKKIQYVQGESLLMFWIKSYYQLCEKKTYLTRNLPTEILREHKQLLTSIRQVVNIYIEEASQSINTQDYKKQTPLMLATDEGDNQLAHKLIKYGADIDLQDFKGRTALHAALLSRSVECTKMLLDKDAATHLVTKPNKQTCLHFAVLSGRPSLVKMIHSKDDTLLKKVDRNGLSPLDISELAKTSKLIQSDMKRHGKPIGSRQEYQEIYNFLNNII